MVDSGNCCAVVQIGNQALPIRPFPIFPLGDARVEDVGRHFPSQCCFVDPNLLRARVADKPVAAADGLLHTVCAGLVFRLQRKVSRGVVLCLLGKDLSRLFVHVSGEWDRVRTAEIIDYPVAVVRAWPVARRVAACRATSHLDKNREQKSGEKHDVRFEEQSGMGPR